MNIRRLYGIAPSTLAFAVCFSAGLTSRAEEPAVLPKRRFRFSLKVLLFAPLAAAIFLVLFNPRIITGHFCYITIERLEVTDTGGFSVGYSRFVTPNTVVSLRFPHGGASGSTFGGAFTWYVRGTASGGGGVNLRRLGLSASDWRDAIRVEAGKTYRIDLGERLVLYSVRDAKTGERHEAYIDSQKYPPAPTTPAR